jgi:hypothetical protein
MARDAQSPVASAALPIKRSRRFIVRFRTWPASLDSIVAMGAFDGSGAGGQIPKRLHRTLGFMFGDEKMVVMKRGYGVGAETPRGEGGGNRREKTNGFEGGVNLKRYHPAAIDALKAGVRGRAGFDHERRAFGFPECQDRRQAVCNRRSRRQRDEQEDVRMQARLHRFQQGLQTRLGGYDGCHAWPARVPASAEITV